MLVFGAGIFLVGQMFHLGGDFQSAFYWWSLGIMPLAWVLKDKWILLSAAFFMLIYMGDGSYFHGEIINFWVILWIAAIYYLNNTIGFSNITGFVTGLLQLQFIWIVLTYFTEGMTDIEYMYGLIYLAIGIGIVFLQEKIREVYVFLGHLVHCGAAICIILSRIMAG